MNDAFTCDAIRTPIGCCSPINRLRRSGLDAVDAALGVMRQPRIPDDGARVNPSGGAISLGHPLEMLLEAP
jgi:hypothetical protein